MSALHFLFVVLSIGVYAIDASTSNGSRNSDGLATARLDDWTDNAGLMIGDGLENVFLAFGLIAAIAAVVTALFAIETNGRVLEEVSP